MTALFKRDRMLEWRHFGLTEPVIFLVVLVDFRCRAQRPCQPIIIVPAGVRVRVFAIISFESAPLVPPAGRKQEVTLEFHFFFRWQEALVTKQH